MNDEPQPISADFLANDQQKTTRRQTLILAAVFTVIVTIIAALGANASYRAATKGTTLLSEVGNLPLISDMRKSMFGAANSDGSQTPVNKDRMNVLVLGVGGQGHDGSQLTDTIILVSVDTKDKKVAMLSLPRDLAYPLGEGRFEKINAINAYAEQDFPGKGSLKTAEAISKLLEVPIDHTLKINFEGFASLIDALGGVDLNVERSFTDTQYPTLDDKWMVVSFKKGQQHLDGSRALIFVRSRHGSNGEGSDFARSRRQQLVIMAVRTKLLSLGTLADPRKLAAVYQAVSRNIQTDLSVWDMMKLAPLAQDFTPDRVSSRVLTDAPDAELVAANVNGAFMLFPRKPDWSEIRELAQNPFVTKEEQAKLVQPIEGLKIEIKNGTNRTGFASQIAAQLEKSGYEINAFGNALRRGYERTVIFDLTNGKKSVDLLKLKRLLNADISLSPSVTSATSTGDGQGTRTVYANGMIQERVLAPTSDFLVILGEASYSMVAK